MTTFPHGDPKGAEEPNPQPPDQEDSLDRTIEDSFPASDPPSSIPDPDDDESAA